MQVLNFYEKYIWNNPITKPIHKIIGTQHLPTKSYDVGEKVVETTGNLIEKTSDIAVNGLDFLNNLLNGKWFIWLLLGGGMIILILIFKK